jgi:hypothetical protein
MSQENKENAQRESVMTEQIITDENAEEVFRQEKHDITVKEDVIDYISDEVSTLTNQFRDLFLADTSYLRYLSLKHEASLVFNELRSGNCSTLKHKLTHTLQHMSPTRELSRQSNHSQLNEAGFKATIISILMQAKSFSGHDVKITSEREVVVHGITRYIDLFLDFGDNWYVIVELKFVCSNYLKDDCISFFSPTGQIELKPISYWLNLWLTTQAEPYARGIRTEFDLSSRPRTIVLVAIGSQVHSTSS